MSTRNLDALFAPASVAIAGATARAGSVGAQVTRNLIESFGGSLYGINPNRPQIAGIEMHGDIRNLPEAPDLGIVVTPASVMVETVQAFAEKGARAALVITDAKRGEERAADVRLKLRAIAERAGMRIVGPNALGIASPTIKATMSSLTTPVGGIAFIGQATMAAGAVSGWAVQQHLGFSGLAAAGDMVDVDFGDVIDWFATDARTRVITVFVERIGETRKFLSAMRHAARMKPVIVLRMPSQIEPPEREAVFAAALRRAGALGVYTLEDLFATLEAVAVRLPSDAPPGMGRRLAVISNGESLGALARSAIKGGDVQLAQLSEETVARLGLVLPPGRKRVNPVDILPDAPAERYGAAMEAIFEDKGVDAVLGVFGPSGSTAAAAVARAIAGVVEQGRLKPGRRRPFVMTSFSGGAAEAEARDMLGKLHIPSFETPSNAVRAFTALVALRRAAERVTATPEFVASLDPVHIAEVEHRARSVLAKGGEAIDGFVAQAIRRALWLGRADGSAALTWRIEIVDDNEFGPAIFFGPGGPFASIAIEHTAALPPLNAATAQELIAASAYARAAQASGALDDGESYALAALLVRVSDLIALTPSIRTLVIDGISAAESRPVAPAEALSGLLAAADADPDSRFAIRPYPTRLVTTVTGKDGATYRLRPMRAEDEPGLRALGAKMSPEDLRLRFFQPIRALSHEMATRLTQIDYDREMAFALLPPDQETLLAVVRLHRDAKGEAGEFAVTVRSDLKGMGLGRMMMERIIDYARESGLKNIFGLILAENQGMLRLARALGFSLRTDPGDATVVRAEMPL
jgi:acyl-CoA synthetase (NDP forming)/RimJ/RimL family protein N-acetyltransferase